MSDRPSLSRDLWVAIPTKLEPPRPLVEAIERPRLLGILDEGATRRLLLLSAPAGYGKTTLAAQWLARGGETVAWLSLDVGDDRLETFGRYLVAAIERACPGALPRSKELTTAPTVPPETHFSRILLSELASIGAPLVIGFDEAHLLTATPARELLRTLVEGLPRGVRLLLVGRSDPALPLARWRGRGWVAEVRARDLRFSPEECRAYFAGGPELDAAAEDLDRLCEAVEGWPAGLQLARISMSRSNDPGAIARSFTASDRLISDFLIDEVLAAQPPEVRRFLAATASLDRFCADLCDRLLPEEGTTPSGAVLLREARRRQLFLVPLDNKDRWFRYHHLFAQLLGFHLPEAASAGSRREVARRAAEWFEEEGLVEEALRQWIAAGELEAAAETLGRHLHEIIERDFSRRILASWLALFPAGAENARLPLLVAHAYLRVVRWDFAGIESLLERAASHRPETAAGTESASAAFEIDLEALQAFCGYWSGDVAAALRHADRALALLGEADGGIARSFAVIYRAGALARLGRVMEAERFFEEAIDRDVASGCRRLGELLHGLGMLQLNLGELDAVAGAARRMLAAQETAAIPAYLKAFAVYFLGVVAFERDELEEAERRFREVVETFRHLTSTPLYADNLIGLALVAERRGDLEALAAGAAEAHAFALETGDVVSLAAAESLESRVSRGEGSGAVAAAPVFRETEALAPWLESRSVTYAENLLQHPDAEVRRGALPFVEERLARVGETHNRRLALRLLVLKADGLAEAGRHEEALEVLAEAVRQAEPQKMMRPFLGGGSTRRALLEDLVGRLGRRGLLARVLATAASGGGSAGEPEPRVAGSAGIGTGPPLTLRELEALELLARRLTNKEIAARLGVTSAAVKKRLESVYLKLDVHGRREAVAAAVARGLIEKPAL